MSAIDLVYFAVVVLVGITIYSQFDTTATSTLSASTTSARAAQGNVSANVFSGFQTVGVGPTIIAAVIVLAIVGGLLIHK